MARKILLADDSVTAQNMGRKILTDAGYEVMTVNNGSAALKRVTELKPDLIVLDVYMPGYSGLEVCQRLKDSRDTSRIPILLTVGKLEPFKPEDARRVSADAFIVKPFEASELLSALTRLEDCIVPSGESPRFSNTVSGIERFVTDAGGKRRDTSDTGDTGWKSRIRFPSKKKTEEPEPDTDFASSPGFRNFKGGPAKPPAAVTPAPEAPVASQEPGLVSDLPHDITPDELDALSALVAKLDGPRPQAEEVAPIGDKIGPVEDAQPKAEAGSAPELKGEVAAESSSEAPAIPAQADAPVAISTVETIPVETPPESAEATAVPESKAEEAIATSAAAGLEIAAEPSVEEPAPVSQDDEPFFATAASAIPELSAVKEPAEIEPAISGQSAAAVEVESKTPDQAPVAETEAEEPRQAAKAAEEGKHRSKVEELLAEAVSEEAVSEEVAEELAASEDHAPSEEELAEALRLLTPLRESTPEHIHATASVEHRESSGAAPAQAVQAHAGNGSRWLAEAVELAPEEMSISLEAEMFRSMAWMPAVQPVAAVATAATDPSAAEGEPPAQPLQPEASSETLTEVAPAATEEPAAPGLEQPSGPGAFSEPQEPVSATLPVRDRHERAEVRNSTDATGEAVSVHADHAAAPDTNHHDTGDQEAMSKDGKTGKSSRSGWHQIREAAPAPKEDVVEAAKHSQAETGDETPKAMAAAAASDDTSSSAGPDPSAIASIVDSVLADLRPRIVEEIAKKLGKR